MQRSFATLNTDSLVPHFVRDSNRDLLSSIICPLYEFRSFQSDASGRDTEDSSALEDEVDERLRCLDLRRGRDATSSAPDTTSSDNSPTLPRRTSRALMPGAGVDGGSSSDGVSSSESEPALQGQVAAQPPPHAGDPVTLARGGNGRAPTTPTSVVTTVAPGQVAAQGNKTSLGGGGDPNQPSESMAYHMFELARSVLSRAGGAASSMAVFNHQANMAMDPSGPHRNLHLCAFQLGLYALGLYNSVNSTWQSRTYSSHVSWISNQVS